MRSPVWAINLVVPGGAASIQAYLDGASKDVLYPITSRFYETYPDDFDFLYLVAEVDHGAGRFSHAHRPSMPENGQSGVVDDPRWGSAGRLRGVVALRLGSSGNGPTLHETFHYWGVFLDRSFGFGRDRTHAFGPHWGLASVFGQVGGFDASTLRCANGGTYPACTPEPGGRIRYSVGSFGPTANGGDIVPYAPIELYLMGLAPASEVDDILVLMNADFLGTVPGEERMLFEADGIEKIGIEDIVSVHGEKMPIPEEERAFRGAFLLVSDEPAPGASLRQVERWSRVFSGAESSERLLSFASATGGRARMDTRILPD